MKADNPIGQWNTLKIKMAGTRVWVSLNDKPTVEGQVLDNFFDPQSVWMRGLPQIIPFAVMLGFLLAYSGLGRERFAQPPSRRGRQG